MNPSLLDAFRLTVQEQGLGLYAVRIHRPGHDDVTHFWRSDDKVHLFSGSKTFTALGVLLARDEGRFGLDDRLVDLFPAYADRATPGTDQITVRHLLHMQSGRGEFWFGTPDDHRELSADWLDLFFRGPGQTTPGTSFVYSNACTYVLSRLVAEASGQTLRDFLVPRLFTPLDIVNPQWHTCPAGHSLGAIGLYLKNSDYAKLGRLLLQDGAWDGREVVKASSVVELRTDVVKSGGWGEPESDQGYGFQVWKGTHPGAYRADGLYGQFSIVFPEEDAVVTVTAHEERRANDILRYVYRDIVPRLG